jgi:hypothetical protein
MNWTILTSYKAMHETKSPHVNHIHQYKSHNTIDLDLQSIYFISIRKYYNDSMQQDILSKLQANLKWERALILIHIWVEFPMRGAHGISKEGTPCGKGGAANCGRVGCHLSTHQHMCQSKAYGRRARHLSYLWAATSRVRHLSKRGAPLNTHVPKSVKIPTQSFANHMDLVPFDSLLDFCLYFVFNIVPTYLFIFPFADFY